jgi:hypothetical protein
MSDFITDTVFTNQTIREFGTVMDRFEALELEELDELSGFLADFTQIEAAEAPTFPEFQYEKAQDFLLEFQEKWFAQLEADAATAPILNVWKIADLGLASGQRADIN